MRQNPGVCFTQVWVKAQSMQPSRSYEINSKWASISGSSSQMNRKDEQWVDFFKDVCQLVPSCRYVSGAQRRSDALSGNVNPK
jgi:hypothetical protein